MLRFSLILGTIERTYEVERFLSSLELQTYRNFELIIVDQNPDDRLVQILAPYKGEFPILHLKSKPGLSRAFNLGLEHASGDLVTFPGDDCQYPSDLLDRVAQFFSHHPETDGLTGRSMDEAGTDTNGTFDTETGVVDRFNVWNRSTAYTFFLRLDSLRGVRFDEEMGPGAGTAWGAGNDHDFLLQLLTKGASLYYDPGFIVLHPDPASQYDDDEGLIRRAYAYDCGAGRAIRKHKYPLWFRAWWLIRPLGGLALCLVGLKKRPGVKFRWNVVKGRLRGLLGT